MKKLTLVFAFMLAVAGAAAQSMYVHKTDGNVYEFKVSDVDSINFAASSIKRQFYKLTYIMGAGKSSYDVNYNEATKLKRAVNSQTRTFINWNTESDGSGYTYNTGMYILMNEDFTLHAQYIYATDTLNGFGYVDLGLPSGTKWATCNVGATRPEYAGNKDFYTGSVSSGGGDSRYSQEYYTELVVEKMGEGWECPSNKQAQELVDECIWTWTDSYYFTGVSGYIVESKVNDNHIFLNQTFVLPRIQYSSRGFIISKDEYGEKEVSSGHYYMRAVCK